MTFFAPTRLYIDAMDQATARDLRDAEHLAALDILVSHWLDQLAPYACDLGHPDARWQPGDLVDALRGEFNNIRGETKRLRGPLVLEEE